MPKTPDGATPAEADVYVERNRFYESLSMEARERFLDTLAVARERGATEDAAWQEAVVAAETAYPPRDDVVAVEDERRFVVDDGLPPPGP